MRGIRLSDRVLIAGQTGKGKTTLARYIVEGLQPIRTIVLDPKDCLRFAAPDGKGQLEPCRTPDQLAERMREPLVHYVPASFARPDLEEACEIIWLCPGPNLVWVDEAAEITGANYCPEGLRLNVTQGREHRKVVIACTQRLAEAHPVFRSQSEHVIIFTPPPVELDLKMISGNVRREARELERALAELHSDQGDFSHLWYVRDTDELRACAPLPLGDAPGAPREPATAAVADEQGSPPCEDSDSGSGRS